MYPPVRLTVSSDSRQPVMINTDTNTSTKAYAVRRRSWGGGGAPLYRKRCINCIYIHTSAYVFMSCSTFVKLFMNLYKTEI